MSPPISPALYWSNAEGALLALVSSLSGTAAVWEDNMRPYMPDGTNTLVRLRTAAKVALGRDELVIDQAANEWIVARRLWTVGIRVDSLHTEPSQIADRISTLLGLRDSREILTEASLSLAERQASSDGAWVGTNKTVVKSCVFNIVLNAGYICDVATYVNAIETFDVDYVAPGSIDAGATYVALQSGGYDTLALL